MAADRQAGPCLAVNLSCLWILLAIPVFTAQRALILAGRSDCARGSLGRFRAGGSPHRAGQPDQPPARRRCGVAGCARTPARPGSTAAASSLSARPRGARSCDPRADPLRRHTPARGHQLVQDFGSNIATLCHLTDSCRMGAHLLSTIAPTPNRSILGHPESLFESLDCVVPLERSWFRY